MDAIHWKTPYLRCINTLKNCLDPLSRKEQWQDPTCFYDNAVTHHTPLRYLNSTEDAFTEVRQSKTLTKSDWVLFLASADKPANCSFKLYDSPDSVPVELLNTDNPPAQVLNQLRTVQLPNNWQFLADEENQDELIDTPIYTNLQFPNELKRLTFLSTNVPKKSNPTGYYRLTFSLPAQWVENAQSGERSVHIILHGAGSGVSAYVNGEYIGYGQDSMTETEFVIPSNLLKTEDNILNLVVYRWTDGSYLEDQDQWWLSGVFRDIELQCRVESPASLVDYVVTTLTPHKYGNETLNSLEKLNKGEGTGLVKVSSSFMCDTSLNLPDGNGDMSANFKASIYDADNELVNSVETEIPLNNESFDAEVEIEVPQPQLWSPALPYLYTLVLEVVDSRTGENVQIEATRVGIRSVEIFNGQVLVNEKPITVCGVNRHEWDPYQGKVMTEEMMLKDVFLMKQLNFNAVRCSHYPNVHRWYELCSEHGLFVVDEANIETHGFTTGLHISLLQNNPRWEGALLSRVKAMVQRSRNYPAIIGWSLGNESGCGVNTRVCADWVRATDPSRFLQYEGGSFNGDSPMILGDGRDPYCSDVICPMYDSPLRAVQVVKEENKRHGVPEDKVDDRDRMRNGKLCAPKKRPFILCEYAHAMGNSSGNLHHYWELFRSDMHPQMQGGFIWDWVEQGLSVPQYMDGNFGYGGDFGPTSGKSDTRFCINGMVSADRIPHPACFEAKHLMQPVSFRLRENTGEIVAIYIDITCLSHCPPFSELAFEWEVFGFENDKRLAYGEFSLKDEDCPYPSMFALPSTDPADKCRTLGLQKAAKACTKLYENGHEYLSLVVSAKLAVEKPWADKGYLIATQSFNADSLSTAFRVQFENLETVEDVTGTLEVISRNGIVQVVGPSYGSEFDCNKGKLLTLHTGDQNLIVPASGLSHSFYRAATDNDLGGLESMLPVEALKPIAAKIPFSKGVLSYDHQWKGVGLDKLVSKTTLVEIAGDKDELIKDEDFKNESLSQLRITVHEDHLHNNRVRFKTKTIYCYLASGILVDIDVAAQGSFVKNILSLPRVGAKLILSPELNKLTYLGCGPHETYPDRKKGAQLGVYSTTVDDMHVAYMMPCENGGRADVHWASFSGPNGESLRVSYAFPESDMINPEVIEGMDLNAKLPKRKDRPAGYNGAQFSASRYTVPELRKAMHQFELPEVDESSPIHVHFDTAHMGLGGDVSWLPKCKQQYLVGDTGRWRYQLKLEVDQSKPVSLSSLVAHRLKNSFSSSRNNGITRSSSSFFTSN